MKKEFVYTGDYNLTTMTSSLKKKNWKETLKNVNTGCVSVGKAMSDF